MKLDIVLFIAKKRKTTQVSLFQEKCGANGKTEAGVSNVKAEPVQRNRVVIEARNQPVTNLIGARSTQDKQEIKIPDNSVYEAADRACWKISRKQAICSDENVLKCVDGATHDSNTGHSSIDFRGLGHFGAACGMRHAIYG